MGIKLIFSFSVLRPFFESANVRSNSSRRLSPTESHELVYVHVFVFVQFTSMCSSMCGTMLATMLARIDIRLMMASKLKSMCGTMCAMMLATMRVRIGAMMNAWMRGWETMCSKSNIRNNLHKRSQNGIAGKHSMSEATKLDSLG